MDIYGDITSNIDLWGSELDTIQDTLPLSPDADLGDWFPYRNGETKMSQVILNDKLMTDALCIQAPVKVEHSYSLNSDGDSIPESPDGSLDGNKMDDLDADSSCNLGITSFANDGNNNNPKNQKYLQLLSNNNNNNQLNYNLLSSLQNKAVSSAANGNLHVLGSQSNDLLKNGFSNSTIKSLINGFAGVNQGHGTTGTFDTTSSISSMSDIDIEDAHIKEEPLSPNSSCPPSPNSHNNYSSVYYNTSNTASNMNMTPVNLSNMAFAQNDLMYEHKGNVLNMTSNTQSLLKNPQLILGSTSAATTSSNRVVMSKANIKIENQMSAFGLPPTPPSSLPSDESEGNQSPEHHLAPMSPPNQTIAAPSAATPSTSKKNSCAQQYSNSNSNSTRGYSNSTRQPIHTPLISSQPKGSTGELILTEEEKRTLLAEGYPIPQRLPLTKAEEKSLKKVRRKIKNKISAQESRRKKKEYMDQLERRVEKLVLENNTYRTRIETLEDENSNIMKELQRLQQMLNRQQASMRKN